MAKAVRLCLSVVLALLLVSFAAAVDPPETSPSPAPEPGAALNSPLPPSPGVSPPAKSPASPSPLPEFSSPPAPSKPDLPPVASPTPSPTPAPAPAPAKESEINHASNDLKGDESTESYSGLSGGQKAGIAIGALAGACLVGMGALVYKKRQQNIRRTQYGYAARREIL
ncbi:alpha carbonic anhydrase 8-like [Malania oleifera]|uniref:alpha carbonic anhydrase 8-like n=1 Tax=Malania oleifera TaxID=397392 RepID=UPI0025AEB438|nr:alpha carbonic anhydrase 8-like [Malania oleifera]